MPNRMAVSGMYGAKVPSHGVVMIKVTLEN